MRRALGLIAALAFAQLGFAAAPARADDALTRIIESDATAIDLTGDGKPELKREFGSDGVISRYTLDRDGDGKVDETYERDADSGTVTIKRGAKTVTRDFDGDRLVCETVVEGDTTVTRTMLESRNLVVETTSKKGGETKMRSYPLRLGHTAL